MLRFVVAIHAPETFAFSRYVHQTCFPVVASTRATYGPGSTGPSALGEFPPARNSSPGRRLQRKVVP
jgi:hypothetical protein